MVNVQETEDELFVYWVLGNTVYLSKERPETTKQEPPNNIKKTS